MIICKRIWIWGYNRKTKIIRMLSLFLANASIKLGIARQADFLWGFIYPHTQLRKTRDETLRKMMVEFIKPGDLVFDIGAGKGIYTELFLSMGAREVVAVEPVTKLAKKLVRPHVQSLNLALGAYNHEAAFYEGEIAMLSTLSPEHVKYKKGTGLKWSAPRKIHVTTLDMLAQFYGEPTFIKIDAEGYESEIFKGLHFAPKALAFEFIPEDLKSIKYCADVLNGLGSYQYTYTIGLEPDMDFEMEWDNSANVICQIKNKMKSPQFGDIWAKQRS